MELEQIALCAIDCAKTYPDGTRGLLPSNLRVEPGEIMALLGPSGCGKTTLLRILAGLESPDDGGTILFGEQDVTQCPIEQRRVGMVFQHYALFPQMSVASNIGYGLKIRGVSEQEIKRTVGELVDLVRLNGLEHRKPKELSGGQRQRAMIAMALACKPRLLIADEPTTALDPSLRIQILDLLKDLQEDAKSHGGMAVILITHDLNMVRNFAQRVAVMYQGKLLECKSTEEVFDQPDHPYTNSLVNNKVCGI